MPLSRPVDAIEAAQRTPADAEAARRILRLLDLTSLRGDETAAEIEALCCRALRHAVAAVCIYPGFLPVACSVLAGSAVRIATVANFPEGGDDIGAAAAEVAAAVAAGAQEVDVVAPLAAIRAGDLESVAELVEACRAAARPTTLLKLILETGLLAEPSLITAVARTAVMAGVDFLKTSTGKRSPGATLEAAAALLEVIAETGGRVGLKLSGGIRTLADAAPYLALVDATMGRDWADSSRLRFGASALLDDLVRVLQEASPGAGPR